MDFSDVREYAEGCLRDAPPPCVSACPLGVDVRGLVSKVRAGRAGAAYRAYREAVLFPRVVSAFCEAPCRGACVRGRLSDGPVDLPAIERGVVAAAGRREGGRYAVPKRGERVAVVIALAANNGSGLTGLACAHRLASKGFGVTVYEELAAEEGLCAAGSGLAVEGASGGFQAGQAAEEGPASGGQHSAAAFMEALAADREELFMHVCCEWLDVERLPDAGALQDEYDAVYDAAAGPGGSCGEGVAAQIACGLAVAAEIEQYFRKGELSGGRTGGQPGEGVLLLSASQNSDGKPSADDRFYKLEYDFSANEKKCAAAGKEGAAVIRTKAAADSAQAEAERCPMCNCSACIDACPMIRRFKQNPKRIAADLGVSVLPVGGKIMRVASRMMNSCNLCGLCTAVCPAGVDTCAAMEASRRILKGAGHMAPAYHDFWMDDLAFSMSGEAYGIVFDSYADAGVDADVSAGSFTDRQRTETGIESIPLLFFPGCQLSASLPDTVSRTYDYMCEAAPGAAMMLACCGVPADWAAEDEVFRETAEKIRADWERLGRPEVLFACSACMNTFAKALPEVQGRLVYEWLAERGVPRGVKLCGPAPGLRAAVYDPCNSRRDAAGQAAVRTLAEGCGFLLEELAFAGEEAACCGFGGHIYPANPGLLEAILDERAADRPELPRITYCANCRDLFLYKGIKSAHILELLFPAGKGEVDCCASLAITGDDADGGGQSRGRLPTLTERRENRRALKARYASDKGGSVDCRASLAMKGDDEDKGGVDCFASLATVIEAKMDKLLLLREDAERTIAQCEGTGAKFIDSPSGHFFGSHRERLVTVWVEYESGGDGTYTLHNIYTHRMLIEGSDKELIAAAPSASHKAGKLSTPGSGDGNASAPGSDAGKSSAPGYNGDGLACVRCGLALTPGETKFSYLGHEFSHVVPKCPACGQAFIPEGLAAGRIAEVEAMLEDK